MTDWQAHGEPDAGIDPDTRLKHIRETFVA